MLTFNGGESVKALLSVLVALHRRVRILWAAPMTERGGRKQWRFQRSERLGGGWSLWLNSKDVCLLVAADPDTATGLVEERTAPNNVVKIAADHSTPLKVVLSLLVALTCVTSGAWGQPSECPLHYWISVSNYAVAQIGGDIVISADLAAIDGSGRNPADYYQGHGNYDEAWRYGGGMSTGAYPVYSFGDFNESSYEDSIQILRSSLSHGEIIWVSALTVTATRFEFRFPASLIEPGQYSHVATFEDTPVLLDRCYQRFEGTFERTDKTPARRASWGSVKAAYR